jgi:putative membrane protein
MEGAPYVSGAAIDGTMSDENVVSSLIAANAAQVALGKVAADSAANAEVRAYAALMVSEHSEMNASLQSLARRLGLHAVEEPASERQTARAAELQHELHRLEGLAFDRAYMAGMVRDHRHSMQVLSSADSSTSTPALDSAIAESITRVQAHLDRAQEIARGIAQ